MTRKDPIPLKGNKAENVAKKILESEGWVVHRAVPITYMVKRKDGKEEWRRQSNDLWGCIDLLAMHPKKGYRAIQVTTQKQTTKRRRKIEALPWPYLEPFVYIEVWETRAEWEGRRGRHYYRVHRFNPIAKDLVDDLSKKVEMHPKARALYLWDVLPDVIEVPREML